jgi:DNA repair exonuclease SbcCD ATPase subunit
MLRIDGLKFKGIGKFVDLQEIDFTNMRGIVQVNGNWIDTGGSSGAGKSSVFNALNYLLGMCSIPTTTLKSTSSEEIYVEGTFNIDGEKITIIRGTKVGLSIIRENGSKIEGKIKVVEEYLNLMLGISRDLLSRISHKAQDDRYFFLSLTPKETYNFLSDCLGLSKYQESLEKLDIKAKSLKAEMQAHVSNLSAYEQMLQFLEKDRQSILEPEKIDEEQIKLNMIELKRAIDIMDGTVLYLLEEQDIEISGIKKPVQIEISQNNQESEELKEINNKISFLKSEKEQNTEDINKTKQNITILKQGIQQCKWAEKEVKALSIQLSNAEEQLTQIKSDTCPTCQREWLNGKDSTIELITLNCKKLEQEILTYQQTVEKEPQFIEAIQSLEIEIQELSQVSFEELNELEQQQSQIRSSWSQKANEIQAENIKEINRYNRQVSEIEKKYQLREQELNKTTIQYTNSIKELSLKLQNYKKDLESYYKSKQRLDDLIQEKSNGIKYLSELIAQQKKDLAAIDETKRLIKSFTMQTMHDSLDYIGGFATNILSHIPNMRNNSITFDIGKETATGAIKEEVSAYINMGTDFKRNLATLSGGEKTAIGLAVDLGINEFIESRTGKGVDWYIMDEPFNGFDGVGKEMALEMIKNLNTNKKIIIVDHSSEIKEIAEHTITAVREGDISHIEQN